MPLSLYLEIGMSMTTWRHCWLNGGWTGKRFSDSGCNICRLGNGRLAQNGQGMRAVGERTRGLEAPEKKKRQSNEAALMADYI